VSHPGARLALAIVAAAAAGGASADEGLGPLFLSELPVESAPGLVAGAGGALSVTLELHPSGAAKAASLREWFPDVRVAAARATFVVRGRPAGSRPRASHREASFLVDLDQPPVARLRAEVVSRFGDAPTDSELARFVAGWIEKKSMRRMIDTASTVAARREGDCTEHAVLLAAVARLFGRPSRVVLGIALVPAEGRVLALGHAWAELHDGRGWRVADAAALPESVVYLPMAALANEGPGHLLAALSQLSPVDVRKVVLAPAP
jgi:hypothetical protein